jgi:hypothetical protein
LKLQDTLVRQQYIEKGYERIKHFSWEKSAIEYIRVLKSV